MTYEIGYLFICLLAVWILYIYTHTHVSFWFVGVDLYILSTGRSFVECIYCDLLTNKDEGGGWGNQAIKEARKTSDCTLHRKKRVVAVKMKLRNINDKYQKWLWKTFVK